MVSRSEKKYWEDLSIDYMSEESDSPDCANTLVIHKLPWRSEGVYVIHFFVSN